MALEPEQLDLLRHLAEEARAAPREARLFSLHPYDGGAVLVGPGGQRDVNTVVARDVDDLVIEGHLVSRGYHAGGGLDFTVAPEAYDFLATEAQAEPLGR